MRLINIQFNSDVQAEQFIRWLSEYGKTSYHYYAWTDDPDIAALDFVRGDDKNKYHILATGSLNLETKFEDPTLD